ncbi:hypothetical protein TNCV_4736741, partial [Trichonephila clavipes]
MELISVMFLNEIRFYLVPVMTVCWSERGQRNACNQTVRGHTGPKPEVMVWVAISYDSRCTLV